MEYSLPVQRLNAIKVQNRIECNNGLTCDLSFTRTFSIAIFESYFCYDKDMWITATDYYMYFHVNMLSSLTTILELINFTAS